MNHFVISRLNAAFPGYQQTSSWLSHRLSIFENYLLPSMLGQTQKNFTWLLLIAKDTPEPYASRLREWEARGYFVLLHDDEWEQGTVWKYYRDQPGPYLSTRLDCDDVVHPEFIAHTQEHAEMDAVLNIDCGAVYNLRNNAVAHISYKSNAFTSRLSETAADHVYAYGHDDIKSSVRVVHTEPGTPLWCVLVHDYNIDNKWTWLCKLTKYRQQTVRNIFEPRHTPSPFDVFDAAASY